VNRYEIGSICKVISSKPIKGVPTLRLVYNNPSIDLGPVITATIPVRTHKSPNNFSHPFSVLNIISLKEYITSLHVPQKQ